MQICRQGTIKMQSCLLLVLVVVGAAIAQDTYGPPGPYGGGPNDYGNRLLDDIRALLHNVTGLTNADSDIDYRINDLIAAAALNTELTMNFLNTQYPNLLKEQRQQNAEIFELQALAKRLVGLGDEVNVANATIAQLEAQVAEIVYVKKEQINPGLERLRNNDNRHDNDLNVANGELDGQDGRLNDLEIRSHAVRDLLIAIRDTIHQVYDAINSEVGEDVQLTVTRDEPVATAHLTKDYSDNVAPDFQYGVTALHISDHSQSYSYNYPAGAQRTSYGGYGPSGNPSIYWDVQVTVEPVSGKVTARLFDLSSGGWTVEKAVVNVAVYRLDRRIINPYFQ